MATDGSLENLDIIYEFADHKNLPHMQKLCRYGVQKSRNAYLNV